MRAIRTTCWAPAWMCISLGLLCVSTAGCERTEPAGTLEKTAVTSQKPLTDAEMDLPVARIGDKTITVRQLESRLNRQLPYVRMKYTTVAQKREFLEGMIQVEVLADEATKRGLDTDPEVVLTTKQVLVKKLIETEFNDKIKPEDISEADIAAHHATHKAEYEKPAEVRVAAIIVAGKAQADRIALEARQPENATNKAFRDMVEKHSIDELTRMRGGDLRFFSLTTQDIPQPVREAAFRLISTGDVSDPIDAGNGQFYVLKQTGRRESQSLSVQDVAEQIRNTLYQERRRAAQEAFVENLRKNATIEILDDNLRHVRIDPNAKASNHDGHVH